MAAHYIVTLPISILQYVCNLFQFIRFYFFIFEYLWQISLKEHFSMIFFHAYLNIYMELNLLSTHWDK